MDKNRRNHDVTSLTKTAHTHTTPHKYTQLDTHKHIPFLKRDGGECVCVCVGGVHLPCFHLRLLVGRLHDFAHRGLFVCAMCM